MKSFISTICKIIVSCKYTKSSMVLFVLVLFTKLTDTFWNFWNYTLYSSYVCGVTGLSIILNSSLHNLFFQKSSFRYSFHHIIFFPNSFYLLTQTLAYHSLAQFSIFPPSPLIHLLSLRGFDISVKHFLMEETKFQASRKNVTKIYPPISKPISGLSVQS